MNSILPGIERDAMRGLLVVGAALVLGGLLGAILVLGLDQTPERARGQVVRVVEPLGFVDGMWCSPHHRFCIPPYEDPREARAFYMVATQELSRERGCPVRWRPDEDISRFVGPEQEQPGAFVAACSGSMWLRDGTRIFGPAPRALDEFRVEVAEVPGESDEGQPSRVTLQVDTRELICGSPAEGSPGDGCELAPPFD